MEKSTISAEQILEDPITFELIEEAVIAPCGHSFSEASILDWLKLSNKCPTCNTEIKKEDLKPNYKLRELVESVQSLSVSTNKESTGSTPSLESQSLKELHPSQLSEAGNVLQRAFMNDPWIMHLFANKPSESSMVWFCSLIVSYGTKHGRVWVHMDETTKHIVGAAVWQPPYESGVSLWNMLKEGLAKAPLKFGIKASWRMMKILKQTEAVHIEVMQKTPHWSLYTIGVDPPYQCKGIGWSSFLYTNRFQSKHFSGTKIVGPILKKADEDKVSCYLDTSSDRSIKFFERQGFEVAKVVDNGATPKFYSMVRQPKEKTVL